MPPPPPPPPSDQGIGFTRGRSQGRFPQHFHGRGGRGRWNGRGGDWQQRPNNYHHHRNHRGRGRGGQYHGRGRSRGGRHGNNYNNYGNNRRRSNDNRSEVRYNPSAFDPIEEIGELVQPIEASSPTATNASASIVRIAVEGCCHGELDLIYERLLDHEQTTGKPTDLLICCGDFQSLRNPADFHSSSIPPKFRRLGSFPKYYSGEKVAPILTIFIGGNHEASQPLRELYYGGWVAPKIYYLGACGVVTFRGIRIGGISGIYKSHDYLTGHYEQIPYDGRSVKSVYHVRKVDVERAKLLAAASADAPEDSKRRLEIFVSHDWPLGIEQYGDTRGLMKKKPYFRQEIERNDLGSPPNRELLDVLKPKHWFSAHLHVKFHATVVHGGNGASHTAGANHRASQPKEVSKSMILPTSSLLMPSQAGSTSASKPKAASTSTSSRSELRNNQADAVKALFASMATGDSGEAAEDENAQDPPVFDENNASDTAEEVTQAGKTADNESTTTSTTQFHGLETSLSKCIPSGEEEMAMDPVQDLTEQMTKFLALDKCLPRRQFLSILNVKVPGVASNKTQTAKASSEGESVGKDSVVTENTPAENNEPTNVEQNSEASQEPKSETRRPKYYLEYDPEWLAILKNTHHWNRNERRPVEIPPLPAEGSGHRYDAAWVKERFQEYRATTTSTSEAGDIDETNGTTAPSSLFQIPETFVPTVPFYTDNAFSGMAPCPPLPLMGNPQTDRLLQILQLDHLLTVPHDPKLTPEVISARLQGRMPSRNANSNSSRAVHGAGGDAGGMEDENEIDIDDDEEAENDGKLPPPPPPVAVEDANEIDIDADESDADDTGKNSKNGELPATAEDSNEIDIDDDDDESDEDGGANTVTKRARLED